MKEDIRQLINYVIGLVEDVPVEYRKSSFEVLLNHFLIQQTLPVKSIPLKLAKKKNVSKDNVI